jgi:hypothetical protein
VQILRANLQWMFSAPIAYRWVPILSANSKFLSCNSSHFMVNLFYIFSHAKRYPAESAAFCYRRKAMVNADNDASADHGLALCAEKEADRCNLYLKTKERKETA